MKGQKVAFLFWIIALSCLVLGLMFGISGSLQYVVPGWLKEHFSFAKMRPLHVFLVTQWISCAAVGSMYYFMPSVRNKPLFSPLLAKLHVAIQAIIIIVAVSYFFVGKFTGREYLEFPLWIIAAMIMGWVFAGINLIGTVRPSFNNAPVYVWSWSTGILFFIITLAEASLWQFDHFNANIIRDITVQWKALGSMVGAWNMLIYGSAVYVMCRISGDDAMARSKTAFFFYFLGMANLMFNWGHHTYVVPASPIIKNTAYIISMTELLILFHMIAKWAKSIQEKGKEMQVSWYILKIADNWILLNLVLAIAISVPAVNAYTHGTHITVAHAMGATIGINTTLLLAGGFYILALQKNKVPAPASTYIKRSLKLFNISLLIFWISLIGSGMVKAVAVTDNRVFYDIMQQLQPWFRVFSISGFVLTLSVILLASPLIKLFFQSSPGKREQMSAAVKKEKGIVRVMVPGRKEEV